MLILIIVYFHTILIRAAPVEVQIPRPEYVIYIPANDTYLKNLLKEVKRENAWINRQSRLMDAKTSEVQTSRTKALLKNARRKLTRNWHSRHKPTVIYINTLGVHRRMGPVEWVVDKLTNPSTTPKPTTTTTTTTTTPPYIIISSEYVDDKFHYGFIPTMKNRRYPINGGVLAFNALPIVQKFIFGSMKNKDYTLKRGPMVTRGNRKSINLFYG